MGSTRLPGKVMMRLGSRTVLSHVITRIKAVPTLNEVWVATTDLASDEPIVQEARHSGARVYCGSEQDVLSRYYEAATHAGADHILRVTSDCPLIDPLVLDEMLREYLASQDSTIPCDYMSNTLNRSYPRGLDGEIFTYTALSLANAEARQPHEREHVTPFLYEHPERFRLCSHTNQIDLSRHRWTLDTPEDWELINALHRELCGEDRMIITSQVLELLEAKPELVEINSHIEQKKLGA